MATMNQKLLIRNRDIAKKAGAKAIEDAVKVIRKKQKFENQDSALGKRVQGESKW